MQSELDSEKRAKNESALLRQTAPSGFQKMRFFEKGWQIASKLMFSMKVAILCLLELLEEPETAEFRAALSVYVNTFL